MSYLRPLTVALASLGVAIAACGASHEPQPTPATPSTASSETCAQDSECAVVGDESCGCSCAGEPHGRTRAWVAGHQRTCAVVDCNPTSQAQPCAKVASAELFLAFCERGACRVRKK